MTIVTVTDAAKLARVSRGTIYNKIESGELSKGPDGIDTAELLRVFKHIYSPDADANDDRTTAGNGISGATGVSAVSGPMSSPVDTGVSEQLAWMRKLVDDRDATIAAKEKQMEQDRADAQARLDDREAFWSAQVNKLQALLPAPEPAPAPAPEPSWWKRLWN